ncbi:unnamed protein product [Chrysoparadoxa australica]
MTEDTNLLVRLHADNGDSIVELDLGGLTVIPSVGDTVECNYVHGEKFTVEVIEVKHFLSTVGEAILQQITILGRVR